MQYIMDMVPWWVWLAPTSLIVGALLWFFGPYILGIWNMLPTKVKGVLIAIGTVGIAYLIGRNQGNRTAREAQRQRNIHAEKTRREIHDDVEKRSDDQLDRDMAKWMRDGK